MAACPHLCSSLHLHLLSSTWGREPPWELCAVDQVTRNSPNTPLVSCCRSLAPGTTESEATLQRKLRQKQLQQQFREQMERQQQAATSALSAGRTDQGERLGAPLPGVAG